jgi:DNA-binding SARP family transcriptional activator
MSSSRGQFWPWSRVTVRAPAQDCATPRGDDELSTTMRVLRLAYSGTSPQLPAAAVLRAQELSRLGFEHLQLADELQAAAELHRDSASRVGCQAASVLGVDHAQRPAERGTASHSLTAMPDSRPTPDSASVDVSRPDIIVRVLGQLDVEVAGAQVASWGGQRTRTLFQYLLMHRRPVHREVLMELLWPGHTYSSARNNLNVCVYDLRRALSVTSPGTGHVVYRDACYSLNRALAWDIDRDRFVDAAERGCRSEGRGPTSDAVAALERAVSAYAGPLFDGDPGADWFLPERTALHELFLQVLERLAGLLAERGDLDGAQSALERLLREDGCRESAHRLLMNCFASRGQRDLVARQFQRCIARLDTDLDITPSAETVDLFHALTQARSLPGRHHGSHLRRPP